MTTDAVTVAFITMRGEYSRTPHGLGMLYGWVMQHGLHAHGMPAAVYLTSPSDNAEQNVWELWAPVAGEVADAEPDASGIGLKHVEPMTAATVMYKGPYEDIPPTYELLAAWIAENGYAICGPPMERYYSDPAEVSPEEYLTEVLMPVCKA